MAPDHRVIGFHPWQDSRELLPAAAARTVADVDERAEREMMLKSSAVEAAGWRAGDTGIVELWADSAAATVKTDRASCSA